MADSSRPQTTPSAVDQEDWQIARRGLSLFLNNKPEEAEILFALRSNSFHIKTARCFVLFMNALMTFEEEKLVVAVETLKRTERECASEMGWLKSITTKVFGSRLEEPVMTTSGSEYARRLERQIVLADTKVCSAMLTFLQQEVSGYVRGGWMMRKAWRIYQHTYLQILQLYRRTFGTNPASGTAGLYEASAFGDNFSNGEGASQQSTITPGNVDYRRTHQPRRSYSSLSCSLSTSSSSSSSLLSSSCIDVSNGVGRTNNTAATTPTMASSSNQSPSVLRTSISMLLSLTGITSPTAHDQQTIFVEPAEVVRLMSAISFGYGIFQLCVSFVPPSLLKIIHLLGFEGDRKAGLAALMYARLSEDMRAPLATLSLLCYHTIVRPFCSLHDWNINSGVTAAKQLIAECQMEFNDAALFLFFTGRTERLQSNIEAALEAYGKAVEASTQREVKLLCLHEVAWCHLIRFNHAQAHISFARLQRESRWSESIYAYLAAVCAGADGKTEFILRIHREMSAGASLAVANGTTPTASTSTSSSQLDLFVSRRISKLVDQNGRACFPSYYKLLVYELLYLWNALPSSSHESLGAVIIECEGCNRNDHQEPMIGLADLIAGAAHSYRGENIAALKSYQNCLQRRTGNNHNNTGKSATAAANNTIDNNQHDQHVSAFALYELGIILCATNRAEEGKRVLIKAQSEYTNYDFENRLNVRIHSALKALHP